MENFIVAFVLPVLVSLLTFLVTNIFYQQRKEKREAKNDLFKILMTTRAAMDYEYYKALNAIDVIFADCPNVIAAWRAFHSSLEIDGTNITDRQIKEHQNCQTKLLEAMAEHLGYKNIKWDIIEKPYYPRWVQNQQKALMDQQELFALLLNQFGTVQNSESHESFKKQSASTEGKNN